MKAGAVLAGPCVGTADSWHLCGQQAGVAEQDQLRGPWVARWPCTL